MSAETDPGHRVQRREQAMGAPIPATAPRQLTPLLSSSLAVALKTPSQNKPRPRIGGHTKFERHSICCISDSSTFVWEFELILET